MSEASGTNRFPQTPEGSSTPSATTMAASPAPHWNARLCSACSPTGIEEEGEGLAVGEVRAVSGFETIAKNPPRESNLTIDFDSEE